MNATFPSVGEPTEKSLSSRSGLNYPSIRSHHDRLGHTVIEAAALLGISVRSIYRLIERGLLRPSRALRKIIISRAEIEKFLRDTTGEIE